MNIKLILTLLLLIPTQLWGEQKYIFQDITNDYNNSNVGFTSICEDEYGNVWCGGTNGLYLHNTLTFEKVKLYNSNKPLRINDIYKDSEMNLWICSPKGLVMYTAKTGELRHKSLNFPNENDTISHALHKIVQLNDHHYLIKKQSQLYNYNSKTETITKYAYDFGEPITYLSQNESGSIFISSKTGVVYEINQYDTQAHKLFTSSNGPISTICQDGNKYYIGYKNMGVVVINNDGYVIDRFNSKQKHNRYIKNNYIRQIIRRPNGDMWFGTNEGIYIYSKNNLTLLDSPLETGLPHRRVFYMHQGQNDKVWVSTYARGLAYYSKYNYRFKHILLHQTQREMDKSHISCLCEDSRGYIWIGSEDEGGVATYDPKNKVFIDELPAPLLSQIQDIKTMLHIDNEIIGFGSNGSNTIRLYNYKTKKILPPAKFPIYAYPGVQGARYNNGLLWVHNTNEIMAYDIRLQKVIYKLHSDPRIWQIYLDNSQNLWVCTIRGVYIIKPSEGKLLRCTSSNQGETLKTASVYSICEDHNGNMWMGTIGEGLYIYHPKNKTITPAPNFNLNAEDDIFNLSKDDQNNIWYNTNKGLYKYDHTSQNTTFYGTNKHTLGGQTRIYASMVNREGHLYFGAKSGITEVKPQSIHINNVAPRVFLASLRVNNKVYNHKNINQTLSLRHLNNVNLKASQNSLTFKVVSNNFIKSENNRYKYRLVNYTDDWVEIGQDKEIVFTKIPPGTYTFEAYGSNNDKVWSSSPYRLHIKIMPLLYQRWYAYATYVILLLIIAWVVNKEIRSKLKLKKEIEQERYKSKADAQIQAERVKMFTNISHEFRTPLSLIISPLQHILQNITLDEETLQLLHVADRNAQRLQKIAEQSLDFRLLEIGKLKPHFEKHDLVKLSQDVFLCFEQQLNDRHINFTFNSEFKHLNLLTDGDMIEKIIYNLFSNAIKYTPEYANISLNIAQRDLSSLDYDTSIVVGYLFEGQAITITVSDSGAGIKIELAPHIFERFGKGEQAHESSSGIGLHLCKEYAQLNKGNIQLINEEGKGASFLLNLPTSNTNEFEKSDLKQYIQFTSNKDLPKEITTDKGSFNATILLVEDNKELRDYLKVFLGKHYNIRMAKDGEHALAQIEHVQPDLIITDVSMPGMNGIELTKHIKQDKKLAHIPIIVITAYAERSYQMASITNGADAFFTKPIDQAMLLAQISTSLKSKQRANQHEDKSETSDNTLTTIKKAEKIVEHNLRNPSFQITDLLKELHMSKSTLNRKLKTETGQNTSGFIRDVRLKNACKLLAKQDFNIDEIATFVGFNYTSYFIKSFKDKYGITPTEYRRSKENI